MLFNVILRGQSQYIRFHLAGNKKNRSVDFPLREYWSDYYQLRWIISKIIQLIWYSKQQYFCCNLLIYKIFYVIASVLVTVFVPEIISYDGGALFIFVVAKSTRPQFAQRVGVMSIGTDWLFFLSAGFSVQTLYAGLLCHGANRFETLPAGTVKVRYFFLLSSLSSLRSVTGWC